MSQSLHLHEPLQMFPKPAFRKTRLIDFETGKPDVLPEHEAWVREAALSIPNTRNFQIYIFGYASKLRFHNQDAASSDVSNIALSFERASQVARLLERFNPRVTTRIDTFLAAGNHGYTAGARDNSGLWRAVEVFIFLDEAPPPPIHVEPPPPCPGGVRFRRWSIATPGGVTVSPVPPLPAAVAGNIVVIRRDEGAPTTRTYFVPGTGAGYAWPGPTQTGLKAILQTVLGSLSYSGLSWKSLVAETAFNFKDLDGADCLIASAGAGVGIGYQKALVSVSGKVWFREPSGKCMFATKSFFTNVDTSGKDLQFSIGGSSVGGPLISV